MNDLLRKLLEKSRERAQSTAQSNGSSLVGELSRLSMAQTADTPTPRKRILFLGTQFDKQYLPRLKPCIHQGSDVVSIDLRTAMTVMEVVLFCKEKNITAVISTQTGILAKLADRDKASLDNFAGSFFVHKGIEFVFIHPLKQLVTVNYGQFITAHYISKITQPEKWVKPTPFVWKVLTPSNIEEFYASAKSDKCIAVAIDTETLKSPLAVKECGYTLVMEEADGQLKTRSGIIDLLNCTPDDAEYMWEWIRRLNWEVRAPKVFQNGKYDLAYFARFGAPIYNYAYDTKNFFHCYLSELPKDLAFINAFYVRESVYWKDLSDAADLHTRHEYNCRDHWATANVWIRQMLSLPDWAINNYVLEFPTVFPCHLAEMTGLKADHVRREEAYDEVQKKIDATSHRLGVITDTPGINVNSTPQMASLRKILGCADLDSSDEIHLQKIGVRHPLNRIITDLILEIRGHRKVNSTYLVEGKDLNGRYLYAINPDATDTGRMASKEHHFWCGFNVQNQPRGTIVKQIYISDTDFLLGEADLKQAESRDSGYIAGDEALIAATESSHDFHSTNAAAFFGIPYEQIFDDATGKVINKPIRQISKNTNHGATYYMGPEVMVDTMGIENVWMAKRLLSLPPWFGLTDVTKFLLSRFHDTYRAISRIFYKGVIAEVENTGFLVSKVKNFRAWTRRCFGKPTKNKRDLNALVAHPPQSLNAMTLNRAWIKVFREVWIPNKKNFKLCAQIHDSILFQFRKGYKHLSLEVKRCMEIPTTVEGYDGKVRTFTVPADLKMGKDGNGATRWSETE